MRVPRRVEWGEWTPERLLDACEEGDSEALTFAVSLLDAPSAYDRAHGSDALALAPDPSLSAILAEHMERGPLGAIWWRVLALRHEGGLPWPPGQEAALSHTMRSVAASADPDLQFQLTRLLGALARVDEAEVASRLALASDDEVALAAARHLAVRAPLAPPLLERLTRVRAPHEDQALLARAEGGDPTAVVPLAEALHRLGPMLAQALDALERLGDTSATGPLRAFWQRTWFAKPVHVLAAGAAAALGDRDAHDALRAWASPRRFARKRDLEASALGELARLGDPADDVCVEDALSGEHRAWIVSQIGRSRSARWRAYALRAARDADPAVRTAAVQALEESAEPGTLEALRALIDDPDAFVRESARNALAARGVGGQ